ncbi:class I adenylate-forming enzyme family protein [Cohnella sp. JJ-181]|uniref:class I adenylate-forming enzyme family protein n=1 Tax=Cohnella rhizoplanae TaxID=2974897 RepID=UPI0022FF6D64|nr:class I adenylate-forming enzyme family protein [Cohnella sp. JJ-181]CAI6083529.1 3-[(3aS,4S,7aS)-7a-methyl-1, 5-dioxo-octahydro-1H-inden-4-yl]propanoyl:CoA ligase [Cohnella sp. JJ-181]
MIKNRAATAQLDTVPDLLQRRARRSPNDIVYSFPGFDQHYSWRMIWEEVRQLSEGLLALGIRKGDRVALLMQGRIELVLLIYAAACIGAVAVPLNTYSKKDELRALLRDCKPAALFLDKEGQRQSYLAMVAELLAETGGPDPTADGPDETADGSDADGRLPAHLFVLADPAETRAPFRPFAELAGEAAKAEPHAFRDAAAALNLRDPLVLLYTSGTSGKPKGVLRSTASFLSAARAPKRTGFASGALLRLTDRLTRRLSIMSLLPLYHMGGFATIFTALKACSIRIVMLSHYSPNNALAFIERFKCRVLVGTPFMIEQMLSAEARDRYDLRSLLGLVFTSSAVDRRILERITRELHIYFFMVSYGSTEAGAVANGICVTDRKPHPLLSPLYGLLMQSRLVSGFIGLQQFLECEYSLAGKVDPHVEVGIVDAATGSRLPPGEQGEICIRSHRVMRYAGQTDAADAGPSADGWFRSGDLGYVDARGHLVVTGRIKRIISRGGEKISPVEIERALLKLSGVESAFVVGVPDERYGEQVCACIVPRRDAALIAEKIRLDLAGSLSAFKIPAHILFVPYLPMSPTGKISVADVRELALGQLAQAGENRLNA